MTDSKGELRDPTAQRRRPRGKSRFGRRLLIAGIVLAALMLALLGVLLNATRRLHLNTA